MARVTKRLTALEVEKTKAPGMYADGGGLYLRVTPEGTKSWVLRYMVNHRPRWMGLGAVPLCGLREARAKALEARRKLDRGIDPIDARRAEKPYASILTLEQRVAKKALDFLDRDFEPSSYLYRHFHPNGDLLYVGITSEPLKRQDRHLKGAGWRNLICRIIIEPFGTREEALAAEAKLSARSFRSSTGR